MGKREERGGSVLINQIDWVLDRVLDEIRGNVEHSLDRVWYDAVMLPGMLFA